MAISKKLELIWPHKGEHVLQDSESKKWQFAGSLDLQTRPLIETEVLGNEKEQLFNPKKSNLLIHGENLFALDTLTRMYTSQVKFVYIDPPFNTGQEFEAYDDNYNHSVWLSMMEERLELAWILLRDDGCIAVEIDDTEQAYLKMLLDEQFGRENFVSTISIKRSAATGHKAINPGPMNVTEYIHVYAKEKKQWRYEQLSVPRESYDDAYSQWIKNPRSEPAAWKFDTLANAFSSSAGFPSRKEGRKKLGKDAFYERMTHYALTHAENVIRFAIPNYEGVSAAAREAIDKSKKHPTRVIHLPRDGYSDMFFLNGNRILFLKDKVERGEAGPTLVEPLTNFWPDISWQGIANEGDVVLKKGKKPERLVRRLLQMVTEKGDLVLDFFAGSGTTGSVAHKMGRRWILVDNEHEQVVEMALPRLKRVLAGRDHTGVTESEGWKGGGGFRLMSVGAPLLLEDSETKQIVLNPAYNNGALIRAVCSYEGFVLTGDAAYFHGQNGDHLCHVTESLVDYPLIRKLSKKLQTGQTLTVYALKSRNGLDLPRNIAVRRMNTDLVRPYLSKN